MSVEALKARRLLRQELGGCEALRGELVNAGFVNDRSGHSKTESGGKNCRHSGNPGELTSGSSPLNVFARVASGQGPGMLSRFLSGFTAPSCSGCSSSQTWNQNSKLLETSRRDLDADSSLVDFVSRGPVARKYLVCCNRAENDLHWESRLRPGSLHGVGMALHMSGLCVLCGPEDSEDSKWIRRASMSRRHRFLTTKDMA